MNIIKVPRDSEGLLIWNQELFRNLDNSCFQWRLSQTYNQDERLVLDPFFILSERALKVFILKGALRFIPKQNQFRDKW